jgi:orotate phosphoribosyltransferase
MQASWLELKEKEALFELLMQHNLIRFSRNKDIPLASGLKTDIYIDVRNARGFPKVMEWIAYYFITPICRLHPDRFAEIPDSVGCFAPLISINTKIPYITLRKHPKSLRSSQSDIIGPYNPDESVCFIDDVINDGKTKIEPYHRCIRHNLQPCGLVVLVDRQQGWHENFKSEGIDLPVRAAMTLDEVRHFLSK